jgi:hypothetical protein
MSGRREVQPGPSGSSPPIVRGWLHGEALESLTELNEQCLELLAEHASRPEAVERPLLHSLAGLWAGLDATARRRAAASPYLLVDPGFSDVRNWLGDNAIHDATRPASTVFFSGVRAATVLRLALTYGWHLARSRPSAARLLLGMPPACAERIAACTLRQVEAFAERHLEWLQPRWPMRVHAWRELLTTAIEGEGPALESARMRGLQLLAAEARAALAK